MTQQGWLRICLSILSVSLFIRYARCSSREQSLETPFKSSLDFELEENPEELRQKLQSTEVTIQSLLQHFSMEATNARADIHRNLEDVLHYIEELSKRRCGSTVESYRTVVLELEDQLSSLNQSLESCQFKLDKQHAVIESITAERNAALSEISVLKKQLSKEERLRNETERKLQWNLAIINATDTFHSIENILSHTNSQLSKRNEILQHALSSVTQSESYGQELTQIFQNLESLVYQESFQYSKALQYLLEMEVGNGSMVADTSLSRMAIEDMENRLSLCLKHLQLQESKSSEHYRASNSEIVETNHSIERIIYQKESFFPSTILLGSCFVAAFIGTFLSHWLFAQYSQGILYKTRQERPIILAGQGRSDSTGSPFPRQQNGRVFHHSESSPMQPVVGSGGISPR
eukprot:jgi/Galph1/1861/GphlegSOOS_G539.1